MGQRRFIKDIIYREYVKAALMPILIIEMALLIMYFGITGYIGNHTQLMLLEEASQNIHEIASREVKNISQQIVSVSSLASVLQKENARLFNVPEAFGLPAGTPGFSTAENGATYKSLDNGGSSVFYSNRTPFGEKERQKAVMTEAYDPLFKATLETNPNIVGVYFNSFDSMCRYYPFLPAVYQVFPADMDIPEYNFYYQAAQKNNPEKMTVWTEAYLDPAGQGWMASCVTPIYDETGFLQGVTGIDITIDKMIENILSLKLPWHAGAFLVDRNGVILAMPEQIESILGLKELRQQVYESTVKQDTLKPEEFNLLKNKDSQIAEQMKAIFEKNQDVNDITIGGKSYFLTQSIIEQTDWRLMILVDRDVVFEPVYKLDKTTKRIGIMAFGIMVVFYAIFFSYLMVKSRETAARIADPISRVAAKTTEMGEDITAVQFEDREEGIEEIDLLMKNFRKMGKELREFYTELDGKVKQRTLALTEMYGDLNASNQELQREVSERKLAEERLEKSRLELETAYHNLKNANLQMAHQEKMASIGQLAAGVAHEINNPLGFVISNVATMQDYIQKLVRYVTAQDGTFQALKDAQCCEKAGMLCIQLEERIREMKKEMRIDFITEDIGELITDTQGGMERIKRIVTELKTFSSETTDIELTDIHIGLEGVIKIIANELRYKVNLVRDYGEIPQIMCNQGNLNQVFMNLLLNAAQAIEEQGEIRIQTRLVGCEVVIRITDTGRGIPEEVQKRVFDPFFTTKAVGSGTGLGLSVSYEIVKSHNGSLEIESSSPAGTTFILKIPVVEI